MAFHRQPQFSVRTQKTTEEEDFPQQTCRRGVCRVLPTNFLFPLLNRKTQPGADEEEEDEDDPRSASVESEVSSVEFIIGTFSVTRWPPGRGSLERHQGSVSDLREEEPSIHPEVRGQASRSMNASVHQQVWWAQRHVAL